MQKPTLLLIVLMMSAPAGAAEFFNGAALAKMCAADDAGIQMMRSGYVAGALDQSDECDTTGHTVDQLTAATCEFLASHSDALDYTASSVAVAAVKDAGLCGPSR